MDYSFAPYKKRLKRSAFWVVFSLLCLSFLAYFFRMNVLAAPNDGFAEHGKHLPWTAETVFALTSGYNEDYHKGENTKYLLDFAIRNNNGTPNQAATLGQPVRAIGDGVVIKAVKEGENGGLGRYVKVDHGQGYVTRYDHLGSVSVNEGDVLVRGNEIGKIGDTGFSIGYHLQVSLWKDGKIVPMEDVLNVQGANLTIDQTPISEFGGKTNHFFLSKNSDGLPPAPALVAQAAQACQVNLIWPANANTGNYSIIRDGVDVKILPSIPDLPVYFYPDGPVKGGQEHVYQIKAWNDQGTSLSQEIKVFVPTCEGLPPAPAAPILLSAQSPSCGLAKLEWQDVEDETGYDIYRDNESWDSVGPNVTTYEDQPYENSTHDYFIRAHNEGGDSPDSNSIKVIVPACKDQPLSPEEGGPQPGEEQYGPDQNSGVMDDPVNASTGNYYDQKTDLSVDSVGFPVQFTRAYNSADRRIGSLGKGWQFAYDIRLINTDDNQFAVKLPDGSADYFDYNGQEFKATTPTATSTLQSEGDGFIYTMANGMIYRFDMNGLLSEIEDRNGNLMDLVYNADGYLEKIIDTAGREYQLEHQEGRLTKITDPAGRVVTYTYDENKQLTSVTTPAGRVWHYAYNEDLKMISQTDPKGGVTGFTYDGDVEKVIKITHPDGGVVSFDYQEGQTVQTDENGGKITFVHDDQGRMVKLIDQLGQEETYAYDDHGNMTSYTDRNGHVTTSVYDELGNLLSSTRPNGYKQELTYNSYSQPTSIKDAFGEVKMTYDDKGNLLKRTDALGNAATFTYNDKGQPLTFTSPLNQTLTYSYDAEGNMINLTNAQGGETHFDYDAISRRTKVTDALGHAASFAFDPDSLITTLTDANGGTQFYAYDGNSNLKEIQNEIGVKSIMTYTPLNQLATQKDYEGNVTTYVYDADGLPLSQTDARGFKTTHEYDAAGREIKTILPEGGTILYTYDGNQLVKTITDPNGHETSFDYTSTGAIAKITDANGNTMTYERDLLDRVTQLTDWNGNVRKYQYDALGRLIGEVNPMGGQVSYSYDAASNRLSMTDPLGRVTEYAYNEANQLVKVTDAENGQTTFAYDAVGSLIEKKDANGNTQTYTYDATTNLIQTADGEGNQTQYAYDPRHLLETLTDPNGHQTSFDYDANGLLVKKTNAKGDAFQNEYDATLNLIKTIDEIGAQNSYSYDGQNRLTSHQTAMGFTESFAYDLASNLTTHTDFNGNATQFAYDALNRLSQKTDALGGVFKKQYDGNSNVLAEIDALGKVTAYSYNALDQLAQVTNALGSSRTLSYNVAGELTAQTDFRGNDTQYVYDKLSRLTKLTNARDFVTEYAYDAVGNLTQKTDANGYSTGYAYDKANRLVQVQKPEEVVESYQYDPAGNVLAFINGEAGKTSYTYDPLNQLLEEKTPLGYSRHFDYTPVGLRQKFTDANGHATSYVYDADRRLTQSTDPRGSDLKYGYDANSNLTQTIDKRGFEMLQTYDALNRLVTSSDQSGFEEKYGYDSVSNLLSVINRRGFETKYSYDAIHQKVATTDAKGNTETYTYDPDGNRTSFVDRDSNQTAFEYDPMSNLTQITDALNGLQTFTYDPVDQVLKKINQNGNPTAYAYDGLGRTKQITDALDGKKVYTYNKKDELLVYKNPRGFEEGYQYDADGRLTQWTDQSENLETYTYDPVGNLLSKTDRRGNATQYTYNPNDSLETMTDALNYQWTSTYDPNENRTKLNDARGNDWQWTYEPRNNIDTFKQPEGEVTSYTYDPNENPSTQKLPRGNATTYAYDALDLLTSVTDPLGHVTAHGYDTVERQISQTDAKNQTTQYAYDPLYRLVKVTDPLDGVTNYAYDPVGNLLTTVDANKHATQFTYDPLDRLVKEVNPLESTWKYEYDPNGNMTKRVDANGQTTLYTYDPTDWLTNKAYNKASDGISYSYDANGNRVGMKDASGTSTFAFDPLNRLVNQKDGQNKTLAFDYDGNSNRTQITYPNGKQLKYEFSPNNWMTKMTDWQNLEADFTYDPNKNLVQEVMPNDSQVFYEYDMDDRLTKKTNEARGEAMETYQFAYDPVHNITEETRDYSKLRERGPVEPEHNVIDYTYDPLNRLTNVTDLTGKEASYVYDPVGNRTQEKNNRNFELIKNGKGTFESNVQETINYTYNAANQLTEDSYFNYQYDKNGNRLKKDSKDSDEYWNYAYDQENRMVKSEHFTQPPKPVTSTYLYDGLNRRTQATVGDGKGNDPGHTTWSTYDGFSFDQLVDFPEPNKEVQLRRTDSGRLLSSEVFSGVTPNDKKKAIQEGRYSYYQTNQRFDTTQVLKFDGQASHSYLYDEFGQLYSVNKNDNNADNFTDPHNAYTFSGTQWDEETSLNYYGARLYDSWNGTWSTQDIYRGTIKEPMSLHRTAFVNNNPVNFIDKDGFNSTPADYGAAATKFLSDPAKVIQSTLQVAKNTFETVVNAELDAYEKALTFDVQADVPFLGEVKVSNEFSADFHDGTLKANNQLTGTVLTKNHVYNYMRQNDIVIGKNARLIGEGVVMTVDGQIFYTRAYLNANQEGLEKLGVSSEQEYFTQMEVNMINNYTKHVQGTKHETYIRKLEEDQRWENLYGDMRGPGVWDGVQMQKERQSYLDAINYIKNKGWYYKNIGEGKLFLAILFEQAIAEGISLDDQLFKDYLSERASALETPPATALIDLINRSEVKNYYELLNLIYNNTDKLELKNSDYYFLAKEMLALQEKDNLKYADVIIGMVGGKFGGFKSEENLSKTAAQLIPGSLKKSPSYNSGYANLTYQEILNLAKNGDKSAVKMKKLIENVKRLLDKN